MTAFSVGSLLVPVVLLGSIGVSAAAPTQAQQQAIRSSCQSDYKTYCASVPTGGSAALQCLEQNLSSLSSACQNAVKAATGGGGSSAASGGSSTSGSNSSTSGSSSSGTAGGSSGTSAAGTSMSGGGPAIIVLQPGQALRLMRQDCGADYRAFCSSEGIGGGRALRCLMANASSLSASCKGALSRLGQKFQ